MYTNLKSGQKAADRSSWPHSGHYANLPQAGQVAGEGDEGSRGKSRPFKTDYVTPSDPWPSQTSEAPAQAAPQYVYNLLQCTIEFHARVNMCMLYMDAVQIQV